MSPDQVRELRMRLVEVAGHVSQDIGLGRIFGQILVYLYFTEEDRSLDDIGKELGLSKAAISIAARQLENFGLIRRVSKQGDRKTYYRTADDIASALKQGVMVFLLQKMQAAAKELDYVHSELNTKLSNSGGKPDRQTEFLFNRVKRSKQLRDKMMGVLENPLLNFFIKA